MERSLMKEIGFLDHIIRKYVAHGHEPHKVFNYTQLQVIRYLFGHDGEDVCQKDLEQETGLKKASMTGCLNALEEKGAICREKARDDGRKNFIRLTEQSKRYGVEFEERGKKLESLIENNISEKDLKVFYKVADQIRENIREAENEAYL